MLLANKISTSIPLLTKEMATDMQDNLINMMASMYFVDPSEVEILSMDTDADGNLQIEWKIPEVSFFQF